MYQSRGEDKEKNQALVSTIQKFNELIKKADGQFLFQTEQPTLLDCQFMPFLETISDWKRPSVMANVLDDCQYD